MGLFMRCPCGTAIAEFDDDFVPAVNEHLRDRHPSREYSENEILVMASPIPDRKVEEFKPH
jgi:hypothetical protein